MHSFTLINEFVCVCVCVYIYIYIYIVRIMKGFGSEIIPFSRLLIG